MKDGGLKLAFAGTPPIAATLLSALIESARHPVVQVYTQPDRAAGRGRRITQSSVKQLALAHGLPVEQPAVPVHFDAGGMLHKVDVLVVVAYGMIIPAAVLDRPRFKCINVHMSLLPRWRGAAPVQRAILAGDAATGVSIMQMDAGLDTGPVLLQESCPIEAGDTAGSLFAKLERISIPLLLRTLELLQAGVTRAQPQDSALATTAPKISKPEAVIDWHRPAVEIDRKVRAFNPVPVAQTVLDGTNMRIWETRVLQKSGSVAPPGAVIRLGPDGLDVSAAEGVLRILRLQLAGRNPVSALEFHNARKSAAKRRLA